MKNFILRYSHIIAAFALIIASDIANRACPGFLGQPEAPASLKKLRKF